MQTVLIVIHLMIVLALVGVVLLQRSEGGGLGIGGGGGGMMTARGAANTLTRSTQILGAAFFATSIALGLFARYGDDPTDVLDRVPVTQPADGEQGTGSGGVLDALGGGAATPATPETIPNDDGGASTSDGVQTAPPPPPAIPTE